MAIEVALTLIQKKYSKYQYKHTVNLTQQPTPAIHQSSSTELRFEINMYHPNTSS